MQSLHPDSPVLGDLRPPRREHEHLQLEHWGSHPSPTLNGQPLPLTEAAVSRALAIAPSGESFFLGTSQELYAYQADGTVIWERLAPEEVWAVHLSEDERFAVAAFGDGTIRWFRYADGVPLLVLFPLQEPKTPPGHEEWVLWAPDTGHFRCSSDGAALLGWQVNRGSDQVPDFYSAEQLYDHLEDWQGLLDRVLMECRPAKEILRDLVSSGAMEEPVPLDEVLRGVLNVDLLGVNDLETSAAEWVQVEIRAEQSDPMIGISALKLFVNGVPIRSNYVPDRSTTGIVTQKFDARLLRGKNEIRAVAYNRRRVASYPASRRVFFEGPQPTGKLWILAAGLEDYENPSLNLNWCVNDILESTSSLTERGSDLFEDQDTRALLNQEATRSAIEKEFSQLAEKIHPEDTFVFLYAGHGMVDAAGDFYLVTYDVSAIDGNASPADDR
ncbi:MAG: caspase family protein, partial [Verrucomicrobiota bacterium]